MIQDLVLVGAGGHAVSCIDVVEQTGRFRIIGLVGGPEEIGKRVLGYEVVGTDEDLATLAERAGNLLIAIGQVKSPERRMASFLRARQLGVSLPTVVARDAIVSRHATLGEGTIVMHRAVVNAGARIGVNTIINSQSLIEHGASVGDHCHVSTGAILNGDAAVGDRSFVGSGSVIREGITIGSDCLIGMGLSVRRSLPDGTRYVGETP